MIGRTLSHFRIIEKIGEGGMGVVYRAEDERLRRPVALKVLPPELVGDEERRLRFLREARAAAAVNHTNIATVYEIDEAPDESGQGATTVFIAMELVEGKTLRDLLGRGPLPVRDAVRIASQIADGLSRAHQAHVIHRDLKPDNVIVAADGHAKILDFGLAKLLEEQGGVVHSDLSQLRTISRDMTREGRIFGTAAYMSPEQARGQVVDHRSDLFSFGTMLYEMAAGRLPFEGATATDVMSAIIRDEPAPASAHAPGVPAELDRIIGECLEKDPADRYQHTDQLAVDLRKLRRATDSGVQTVRTPGAPLQADRGTARRLLGSRRGRIAVLGIVGTLVATAVAATWWRTRAPAPFRQGEAILIGDFVNTTGRPEFDTAIRDAFEERMANSTFLRVIRGEELKALVASRLGGEVRRITPETATRLCADGPCSGFVAGRVSPEGNGFRIESALRRRGRGKPIITRQAVVAGEVGLPRAIHDISAILRQETGETPQAIATTPPPSTTSLAAFQLMAAADRVGWQEADEHLALAKRAVEIDPTYVEALRSLSDAYWNLGEVKEYRRAIAEAYRQSSKVTEQERLMIEAYHLEAIYDFETEFERLKAYRRLYPFDIMAPITLGLVLDYANHDPVSAMIHRRAAYEQDPVPLTFSNLAGNLSTLHRLDEVETLAADFVRRGGSERDAETAHLYVLAARRDWKGVRDILDRSGSESLATRVDRTLTWTAELLAAGMLQEARLATDLAWQLANQYRNVRTQSSLRLLQAWLDHRNGRQVSLVPADLKIAREYLIEFRRVATFSVETGRAEPLASLLAEHQEYETENPSRFVREEIAFGRACLAHIQEDFHQARTLLEPIAPGSSLVHVHHVLARTYEALGQWSEAATQYEEVLRFPYRRWYLGNPAFWAIDQFRLGQVYERLGDTVRARHWYEEFLTDWKDADPDIPEVIEARKRLQALTGA